MTLTITANTGDRAAGSNTTRGVFYGAAGDSNVIEYITIASTGNATDFGDATIGAGSRGSSNSSTRVFAGGGYESGTPVDVIEYITTASTGNGTDFGDLNSCKSTSSRYF